MSLVTFVESGTLLTSPLLKPLPRLTYPIYFTSTVFLILPRCWLYRLQINLNSAARAVFKKSSLQPYLTHPQICKLAWYWSTYPLLSYLSHLYSTPQSKKPSYLYSLLSLQANTSTRSSVIITLQRSPVNSCLKITDRSFIHTMLLPVIGARQ